MRLASFAFLSLLLGGCADPVTPVPTDVILTASRGDGDLVTITLTNGSSELVGYNLCVSSLDRRVAGSWASTGAPLWICTAELRGLRPGEEASFSAVYLTPMPAGEYRVITGVELENGRGASIASTSFTVD